MKVVESIKKARENGVADESILQEIRKQNPEKETFFQKAQERGASAQNILDEIIKQNAPQKEPVTQQAPPSPKPPSSPKPPPSKEHSFSSNQASQSDHISRSQKSGKTVLTKEVQEKEEQMRNQFLKRIDAKEKGENISGDNSFFSPTEQGIEGSQKDMTGGGSEDSSKPKIPVFLIMVIGLLIFGAFIFLTLHFL